MNKIIFLIVLIFVASTLAQRHMLMFDFRNQIGIAERHFSEGNCVNTWPAEDYKSGRAGGDYICTVWSARDCDRGTGWSMQVNQVGDNFWQDGSRSLMC